MAANAGTPAPRKWRPEAELDSVEVQVQLPGQQNLRHVILNFQHADGRDMTLREALQNELGNLTVNTAVLRTSEDNGEREMNLDRYMLECVDELNSGELHLS